MSAVDKQDAEQQTTRDFPERTNAKWADAFAAALRTEPHVTLTEEAIEHLSWLVAEPKQYLERRQGAYRLRQGVLQDKRPADGKHLWVLKVKIFGCVTAISPHNDRLVGVWPSPFQAADATHPYLPRRQQVKAEDNTPVAELTVPVSDVGELRRILRHTASALDREEGKRPYSLTESLANEGQRQAGMSVFTRYATKDGRSFLTLTAVAGNNRAHHRLGHHGLTIEELVLGVPVGKLGLSGDPGQVVIGAPKWIKSHLDAMERDLHGDDPGAAEQALKAYMVAAVEEEIVVGADPVGELTGLLHTDNVAEHIQSVLAYDDVPRFDALGRQLLARYHADGRISDEQLGVLNGDALPADAQDYEAYGLSGPYDGSAERLTELRDWRNRTLLNLLFPTDDPDRKIVRTVLAEPAPTGLKTPEINHRARLLAVLQMKGHGKRWNPRAGQVFQVRDGRNGVAITDTLLVDLLDQAKEGTVSDELKLRMHPFLCARELIVPDRGSLDTIARDDKGREEPSERRQPTNALNAIAGSSRGRALLREVLDADREDRGAVRQVDKDGRLIEGRAADRTWVNSADGFPKIVRYVPNEPEPEPEPEPLDDVQAFNQGKSQLLAEIQALHEQVEVVKDAAFSLAEIAKRDSTLRLDQATYREINDSLMLNLDRPIRETLAEVGGVVADAT
jgi:hypothetical protein